MADKTSYNDYFQLNNPLTRIKSRISFNARKKIFKLFMELIRPKGNDSVLDIGVTPDTYLRENNFFEKFYPWPENITMTSPEDASNLILEFTKSKFIQTQVGKPLPFYDHAFDIVFCS